jgi:hypothetical protein
MSPMTGYVGNDASKSWTDGQVGRSENLSHRRVQNSCSDSLIFLTVVFDGLAGSPGEFGGIFHWRPQARNFLNLR